MDHGIGRVKLVKSKYKEVRAAEYAQTLPMTFDAETCLRLTLGWLSNRLIWADVKDVEKMMRAYGQLRVDEARDE
jgi:hypothetical protein